MTSDNIPHSFLIIWLELIHKTAYVALKFTILKGKYNLTCFSKTTLWEKYLGTEEKA